ncbi:MAG: S-layer homology domain-containing protein, partial [Oscillospiraceae bacterium]
MLNGSRVNNSTISGLHNVGQRAKWYPTVIDCFITSKYMTPEAFTTILKDVYGVCQSLVTDWYSASENNNHGSLQTEGLFALATSFKEFDKFDDPTTGLKNPAQPGSMQGGWLGVAKHRLSYKAAKDLADDGSSIEVGLGYSDLNLGTFTQTIKNATMVGLDPREVFNDEDLKFLEKYALYLMNVSTPTFGDWQQGHGYTHASTYNTKWKPLNDITQNPYLLWATSGGTDPNGREPEYKSIVYPEGRKVLLRSGWNKNAVAMQTNADGGQKSHGQHDDLGLNFYAYGQHFLVDGLYHNYDVSHPYNVFLNSTRAHNTIEINGASQKGEGFTASTGRKDPYGNIINSPTGGKAGDVHSENQELNDEYDFVRVETVNYTGNNYDGEGDFKEYRDILFIHPEYAIVTDYINPTNDKENTYTQNWHFIPKSGYTIDNATNTITTNMDGANLILAPVNQKDDFVASQREGCYAVSAGAEIDNPYMAFEKKVKGATTFNTVLYPTKPGEDRTVVTKNIELDVSEAEASAFSLEITNPLDNSTKVGTYYNLHDTTKKGTRTIGNYSTDANIIYVEKSGDNITSMIIRQGTFIYDNSLKKYLVKSEEEISDLKIDLEGSKINMTTSKVDGAKKVNCDKISILNKFITKDVVLNKKNIKFAQKGNCVYMGTTPGFEDSDNPVKPEDKPNNDGGGSGSGAGGSGSHSSVPDNTGTTGPVPVPTQEPGDNGLNSEMKKELENHWAKEEITKMVTDKVVNGISETSLGLTETTTRAEFITMIVRALKLEIVKYSGEFSDVVSGDWYADYLATAAKAGFIHGNEGMADPNGYLTREEMAKILVNAYENKNGTITEKKSDFSDYQDISEWARPFVNKATTVKLLNGMEDGTFLPKEKALREQAIVVIYRLIYK